MLERGRGRPRYSRPGGRRYIGLLCSMQSLFFLFVDGALASVEKRAALSQTQSKPARLPRSSQGSPCSSPSRIFGR